MKIIQKKLRSIFLSVWKRFGRIINYTETTNLTAQDRYIFLIGQAHRRHLSSSGATDAKQNQANMTDTVYNGVFKTYHDNGNICEEGYYVYGKLQGTFREYDESGKLIVQSNYKDHMLHGKLTIWRNVDLGILEETAQYENDNILWKNTFDEESRIAGNYYYEGGQCVKATEYKRNGSFVYVANITVNPRTYTEEVFPIA